MSQEATQKKEDAEAQNLNQIAESKDSKLDEQAQTTQSETSEDEDDLGKWEPSKVKDYVKKLRNENKSYRQRARGLEERLGSIETGLKKVFGMENDEKVDPEAQIHELTRVNHMKDVRLAILETAVQAGITGQDNIEYFEFLVGKKLGSLEENEEMTDEEIQEIAQKVLGNSGNGRMKNSTITHENGKPTSSGSETVTLDQFMKMSVLAKSELYRTNENLYTKLMKEARESKLFV
jgi:hypothetical protein